LGTKWKNSTLFIFYVLVVTFALNGLVLSLNQGSRYLYPDYFQSSKFQVQLEQFASYLNLFELNSISEEKAKSLITVDEQDIVNYRNQLSPLSEQMSLISEEYESLILQAADAGNDKLMEYYEAQKEDKLEALMALYQDNEAVIPLIRKEKEQRIDEYYRQREMYRTLFNDLKSQFRYYLQNPSTGMVHTNLNVANEIDAQKTMYGGSQLYTTDYTIDIFNSPHYSLEGSYLIESSPLPYQGWISVPKGSTQQKEAIKYKWEQWILLAYGLASIILLVCCLTRFKGIVSKRAESSRWKAFYHKLPLDLKIVLLAGATAIAIGLLSDLSSYYSDIAEFSLLYNSTLLISFAFGMLAVAAALLQGQFLINELRSWSSLRSQWRQSLLVRGFLRIKTAFAKAIKSVQDSFIYKSAGAQLVVQFFLLIGLGFFAAWTFFPYYQINDDTFLVCAPIIAVIGCALFFLLTRQLSRLNVIAKAASELAAGQTPNELLQSGTGVLSSLAANMNALRSGFKILQNEQAKSERLKTELITNVSHDLRTPLTSIITYAGLLKETEATAEERAAYIEIINQKSKRLKTMIDDLFEVSKMTSGNVKLLPEKSDLVQLMQQAIAEHKEIMDASDIQFRISLPEEPLFLYIDGQKLWRAFDNLIGNMLKYSLEGTRAYISMQLLEHREVVISFKNVSKYEIGENAEELFERFKRGDTSRHTEGSGLGLAIARSIIELHGGRLVLETDGDLFKATVTLKAG
jgi:signal transduction histidine kinase